MTAQLLERPADEVQTASAVVAAWSEAGVEPWPEAEVEEWPSAEVEDWPLALEDPTRRADRM